MPKTTRKIIRIDEEKCNGCGVCIPSCKEGALQVIDGKVKLVKDSFCDGLGACLGECPQGALTIEERVAEEFNEEAAMQHVQEQEKKKQVPPPLPCGCPGTMTKSIKPDTKSSRGARQISELRQWPIQLALIPVMAPYLEEADFLLLADCSAVAYANLHQDLLRNRIVALACPKLDDTGPYLGKLVQIIKHSNLRSIEVVIMEVPCCSGLASLVDEALSLAGSKLKARKRIVTIEGEMVEV
jgi:NAD-dependent dihydropyrimidine dehydrogenase PreA subunit